MPRDEPGQVIAYPLRQQRLVGAVFGNVTTNNIAPTNKEGQLRLFGSGAECWTPWHEPGQQENESSDRTGDTKHALRHLVLATVCDFVVPSHQVCENYLLTGGARAVGGSQSLPVLGPAESGTPHCAFLRSPRMEAADRGGPTAGEPGSGRLPLFYDEGRDELDRGVAGIDAKMNFAGFNRERLACPVSGCGAPFVFKHQRSFQNISDQRTGMGCV